MILEMDLVGVFAIRSSMILENNTYIHNPIRGFSDSKGLGFGMFFEDASQTCPLLRWNPVTHRLQLELNAFGVVAGLSKASSIEHKGLLQTFGCFHFLSTFWQRQLLN